MTKTAIRPTYLFLRTGRTKDAAQDKYSRGLIRSYLDSGTDASRRRGETLDQHLLHHRAHLYPTVRHRLDIPSLPIQHLPQLIEIGALCRK